MSDVDRYQGRSPGIRLDNFSSHEQPEFVIVGVRIPPGPIDGHCVLVFASTSMTQAMLEVEADEFFTSYDSWYRWPAHYTTTLTIEMEDYVVVTAPTYQQALAALFKKWSPPDQDRGPRPEIEP